MYYNSRQFIQEQYLEGPLGQENLMGVEKDTMDRITSVHMIVAPTLRTCPHGPGEDRPQRAGEDRIHSQLCGDLCIWFAFQQYSPHPRELAEPSKKVLENNRSYFEHHYPRCLVY